MMGEYWRKLNRQANTNSKELKKKEKKENLGIHLSIGVIGIEEGLWECRQRERRLTGSCSGGCQIEGWIGDRKGRSREF
jgi:hypothetical protein